MVTFVLHTSFLLLISFLISIAVLKTRDWIRLVIYSYLIFWSNIILTSFILSSFRLLNDRIIYLIVSLSLGILVLAVCYKELSIREIRFPKFSIKANQPSFTSIVFLFLMIIVGLQFYICLNYLPLTPDTLSSKIVKIYAYLHNHSLVRPTDYESGLVFISPLNSAVTWMFFIIHKVSFQALHFFSLLNWTVIGMVSFSLCRDLGVSKFGALFSTVLLVCSDVFLLNGTGDNDDILVASSFSIAIYAFVNWCRERNKFHILISGLALGISLGIKPIALLYYGLFGMVCLYFIYTYGFRSSWFFVKSSFLHAILFCTCVLSMLYGTFNENFQTRGNPLAFSEVVKGTQNSPFNVKTAGINLASQNMELFLSPILVPTGVYNRETLSSMANHMAGSVIYRLFKVTQEEVNSLYSAHTNRTSISSSLFYDHSVNYGFYPHMLLLSGIIIWFLRIKNRLVFLMFGLSFLIGDIGYCIHSKYVSGIMRYWMILFTLTTPLIGAAVDGLIKSRPGPFKFLNFHLYLMAFIFLIFTAFFGLFNNFYRSIGDILSYKNIKSYSLLYSPRVEEVLSKLEKFNIVLVNDFPNALIHYIARNSDIISKFSVDEKMPNLVISEFIPLKVESYSVTPRILNIEINSLSKDFYTYIGELKNTKVYVNSLPNSLIQPGDKKEVLLRFYQAQKMDNGDLGSDFELVHFFPELKEYEISFYLIDSAKRSNLLFPWGDFNGRRIFFKKEDHSILVKIRHKKTKVEFSGSYLI